MAVESKTQDQLKAFATDGIDKGKAFRTVSSLVDEAGTAISAANPLDVSIGSATLTVNLDAANDEVLVYGSSDGGTTRLPIKVDAAGDIYLDDLYRFMAIQGDLTSGVLNVGVLGMTQGLDPTALTSVSTGEAAMLKSNLANGRLLIESDSKEIPDATSTYCPSSDLSAALEASSVSKASAGVLYGLVGYNSGPAQFILIYNTTSVPGDGAVTPIAVIRAGAAAPFSLDTGKFGLYCSTGISWSNSTNASPFTKALGAADCFINLQYK